MDYALFQCRHEYFACCSGINPTAHSTSVLTGAAKWADLAVFCLSLQRLADCRHAGGAGRAQAGLGEEGQGERSPHAEGQLDPPCYYALLLSSRA
eukprot:scaffold523794_cov17-Prasinocladus_malaysianus.AAC.1